VIITTKKNTVYIDYIGIYGSDNPPANTPNCTTNEMKCGPFTDIDGVNIIGYSCNTTKPPQGAMCTNYKDPYPDCVYGNESGAGIPTPECHLTDEIVTNANQTNIQCQGYGWWCPIHFRWDNDPGVMRCRPIPYGICDSGTSGNTLNGCELIPNAGHPGFMDNIGECLNDFDSNNGAESPEWNNACCEFLRVEQTGGAYLFFEEKEITIY
jgi:hypothetical protein